MPLFAGFLVGIIPARTTPLSLISRVMPLRFHQRAGPFPNRLQRRKHLMRQHAQLAELGRQLETQHERGAIKHAWRVLREG